MINTIVGLQYGDEGKAKIFHSLLEDNATRYDECYAIRWNGGPNAGHTVWKDGTKHVFHQVPSGVIVNDCISIIARGCAFDPWQYDKEMNEFGGTCLIDRKCPVILSYHIKRDVEQFQEKIGTTAKGVGPTFSSFYARDGILAEDCLLSQKELEKKIWKFHGNDCSEVAASLREFGEKYKDSFVDGKKLIHNLIKNHYDKYISFEGSQGYSLDPFSGEYPFVTSSGTNVSYLLWSLGLSRYTDMEVIGVMKPYVTYVGTRQHWNDEFSLEKSEIIRTVGKEFGATTGRPRRIGAINFDELREAAEANGVDYIAMVKSDLLEYVSELPKNKFNNNIKKETGVDVLIDSFGPGSDEWRFL